MLRRKRVGAARRVALDVLRRVEAEGAFASLALDHALSRKSHLSAEDRRLTTQLVYGTLRWRRRLDYALAAHSLRPLEKIEPTLLRILRMTAYQILFLQRIPDWAAVDEGTQLAIEIRGKRAGGFVNAVARKLAGTNHQINWPNKNENPELALSVLHSFPSWMVRRWLDLYGTEKTSALMQAMNQPAPLWIRVNTLRIAAVGLQELLSASGLQVEPSEFVKDALLVKGNRDVRSLAAFDAGLMHVQDAAAQAVCHLLAPKPSERILDACAAPGGKTATMAQLMNNTGEIVAVDQHPARLGLVRKLCDKLGISIVERLASDLLMLQVDKMGLFDKVLLDAPCSAIGVLRRHPEGKWKLAEADLARFASIQEQLLSKAAYLLKPCGRLVYSICSFSQPEGPRLIKNWLDNHPEFEMVPKPPGSKNPIGFLLASAGTLQTWPDAHNMDGFYAVCLQRKS